MELINALSVLGALIGLAMLSVGWLITTLSALFMRRWLAALLASTIIFSPLFALKLQLHYAFFLLISGGSLFVVGLLVSEWVNPRFYWFV